MQDGGAHPVTRERRCPRMPASIGCLTALRALDHVQPASEGFTFRHDMSPRDATAVPADDFQLLVGILPEPLQAAVRDLPPGEVLEVVMDLGRPPEARLTGRVVRLAEPPVTRKDLEHV